MQLQRKRILGYKLLFGRMNSCKHILLFLHHLFLLDFLRLSPLHPCLAIGREDPLRCLYLLGTRGMRAIATGETTMPSEFAFTKAEPKYMSKYTSKYTSKYIMREQGHARGAHKKTHVQRPCLKGRLAA